MKLPNLALLTFLSLSTASAFTVHPGIKSRVHRRNGQVQKKQSQLRSDQGWDNGSFLDALGGSQSDLKAANDNYQQESQNRNDMRDRRFDAMSSNNPEDLDPSAQAIFGGENSISDLPDKLPKAPEIDEDNPMGGTMFRKMMEEAEKRKREGGTSRMMERPQNDVPPPVPPPQPVAAAVPPPPPPQPQQPIAQAPPAPAAGGMDVMAYYQQQIQAWQQQVTFYTQFCAANPEAAASMSPPPPPPPPPAGLGSTPAAVPPQPQQQVAPVPVQPAPVAAAAPPVPAAPQGQDPGQLDPKQFIPKGEGNKDTYEITNPADVYFAQLKRDSSVRLRARQQGDLETANKPFEDVGVKALNNFLSEDLIKQRRKQLMENGGEFETSRDEMIIPYEEEEEDMDKAYTGVSYKEKLMEMKKKRAGQ